MTLTDVPRKAGIAFPADPANWEPGFLAQAVRSLVTECGIPSSSTSSRAFLRPDAVTSPERLF